MYYVRYRLYREIYCHPKVIAFEYAINDILKDKKKILKKIIKEKDLESFITLNDYSIMEGCSKEKIVDMETRKIMKYSETGDIVVTVQFGFISNKTNPFENVYFYDKKNLTDCFKISDINLIMRHLTVFHEIRELRFTRT